MEGVRIRLQKLRQLGTTRAVVLLVSVIVAVVLLQSLLIGSSGGGSSALTSFVKDSPPPSNDAGNSSMVGGYGRSGGGSSALISFVKDSPPPSNNAGNYSMVGGYGRSAGGGDDDDGSDGLELGEDHPNPDDDGLQIDLGNGTVLKKTREGYFAIERGGSGPDDPRDGSVLSAHNATDSGRGVNSSVLHTLLLPPPPSSPPPAPAAEAPSKHWEKLAPLQRTYYISDMEQMLVENRASRRSTIPMWSSPVDSQILAAREEIENAPIITDDPDLYAPAFRNISMFKRSYELMERILKVYVYKEGDRPIFHKPFFTGLYASEGWFMKQMEENTQFRVDDPGKAHLFYMPFSSRILEAVLYVENSHTYKNLIEHLRNYVRTISSKYPFWNRTEGADHFFAGCHDWATRETAASMETTIRALCDADVREGFEIGKDVSLPETNVRYSNDPLRGIGGKPARRRTLLAFFSGQMHGYLRPILLRHWGDKVPDMKIIDKMPHYGSTMVVTATKKKKRKKTRINMYIDYMKDSKYCICPRGYEVNSPRIVEAILYECVPVILSDNFVPPFFEILDWKSFSLVLPESDVPRLREILVSIPQRRYEALQRGVKRVQRHFLWNKKPVKYDLFHMILHNIWFNRIYQLQVA